MANSAMPAAPSAITPSASLDTLFTHAYRQYLPMVRATIHGRLSDSHTHLVDDLAQNTFLAFYSYLGRLDRSRDFGGLLRVMARQSISHHFRAMRNTHERPADLGTWQFADLEMYPATGYYTPAATGFRTATLAASNGDSDRDMDEALRRVRQGGGKR